MEATTIVAVAARDAGVDALVNMSQISAREDSKSPLARQHWLSEKILDWADIGAVHVRPTFFAENLVIMGAATIAAEGKLYLPYGTEKHAPVAAADIARVVSGILADPTLHVGGSSTAISVSPRRHPEFVQPRAPSSPFRKLPTVTGSLFQRLECGYGGLSKSGRSPELGSKGV